MNKQKNIYTALVLILSLIFDISCSKTNTKKAQPSSYSSSDSGYTNRVVSNPKKQEKKKKITKTETCKQPPKKKLIKPDVTNNLPPTNSKYIKIDPKISCYKIKATKNVNQQLIYSSISAGSGTKSFNSSDAMEIARILGVVKKDSKLCNVDIDQVKITHVPNNFWPRFKRIVRHGRCCIRKNYNNCDCKMNWFCDRMAFVSFGNCKKHIKWHNKDSEKVHSVVDMSNKDSSKYPRIRLQLKQYFTYTYNGNIDDENIKHEMNKNSKKLYKSVLKGTKVIEENGTVCPFKYERVLKTFMYACPIVSECKMWDWFRDRDAFVFVGKNNTQDELTWSEIRCLMGINSFDATNCRRIITVKKCFGKNQCEKILGYVDFVWNLTIEYIDEDGNKKRLEKEYFADKMFY